MRASLSWLAGLAIIAALVLSFAHQHSRAMQRAAMHNASHYLERAYVDYERTGAVPPSEPHALVRLFTNSVVAAGVDYRCVLALDWRYFSSDGFLAVTTNRTIIWIDKVRPPKIIDDSYHAPLFGGGV